MVSSFVNPLFSIYMPLLMPIGPVIRAGPDIFEARGEVIK